jgi:hypothetical protein
MLSLVLIVIIVGNVFLSSYKMNQIDWEKIREDVSIVGAANFRDYATHNPSQYFLQGSTSWLSGNFAALTADDGTYMSFRSYYSGVNTADFVDSNTSNVDSVSSLGAQSNFTAQKFGPDRINDTLTEANDGTIYGYLENYVDNDNTDIDSSADIGTHSNFNNQKSFDGLVDSLSEANTGSIDGSFGHTGSAGFSYTTVSSSDMCGSLLRWLHNDVAPVYVFFTAYLGGKHRLRADAYIQHINQTLLLFRIHKPRSL